MGTKERKERQKEEVRKNILYAAMNIVKNEGCESVSIRKIADDIEYAPPVIYSYFLNKEAVLIELSKEGFTILIDCIQQQLVGINDPKGRMEAMLLAYLRFATNNPGLYQLMYNVGAGVKDVGKAFPELATFIDLIRNEMQGLFEERPLTEEAFRVNYLLMISFTHGLIALNRYYKDIDDPTNKLILQRQLQELYIQWDRVFNLNSFPGSPLAIFGQSAFT